MTTKTTTKKTSKKKFKKKFKIPETKPVNWYVDTHFKLKMKRDKLLAQVNEVKAEIAFLEDLALKRFGKEGIEGVKGKDATGFIQELDHYTIADRNALDKWVKRTKHLEVFQNRVSSEAVQGLQAQGLKVPGIGVFTSTHFRTRKR
jgi:hypothetical protein